MRIQLNDKDMYILIISTGEANSHWNTGLYNCTFPGLIRDWRSAFDGGDVDAVRPFGFVQLGSHVGGDSVAVR